MYRPDRSAAAHAVIASLLLMLCPDFVRANPGETLRHALSGLDPAQMPAHVLYDRVVPISNLPALDGTEEAPPVSPDRWRQAAYEITRASSSPLLWPDAAQVRAQTASMRAAGVVPLAVLDVDFARIRPEALADGSLQVTDGKVTAAVGARSGELYALGHAFAATALTPRTYRGDAVTFVLPSGFWLTSGLDAPSRIDIDFDDGSGLRAVSLDQAVTVSYAHTGSRLLRLRAVHPDGRAFWSRFPFEVQALRTPSPSDTWQLAADIPFQGGIATGEAFVYLAEGHAAVTNPIVVTEGFDLDDSMGWDELYALLNQENLIEDLHAGGYDAIVLNFDSATDYIQRNAFLLVKLLQTVQGEIEPGRPFPLIGPSMGGLVSRYALAYMEQQGIPHQVSTFIAFDSPHRGADIPLGLQYWLEFFQDDSADAAFLLSRLDMPAARQMLLYHYTSPPGSTGTSDPLRGEFLADLAAVGDYPSRPRLVAVANGSGAQADQGFAPGAQLIRWEYRSLLVDITGNIWAVPNGASHVIFDGAVDLIWPLPDDFETVTVAGSLPWDGAPGGSRSSLAEMDAVPAPYGDIIALYPAHAFIPTISSLGLDVTDPFYDVAHDNDLLSHTPFDAVYFPVQNQDHVLITPENKGWFLAELHTVSGVAGPPATVATLLGNHPNPFGPRTAIAFDLPAPGAIRLDVFDPRGRLVRTLADGVLGAGRQEIPWDGRTNLGRPVEAGVYLYRLETGRGASSGRMTLVR